MRSLGLVLLGLLAGCSDPTLTLRFRVTSSPEAACLDPQNHQVTSCSDVTMACRAAVSIRVFNPNDPASPYITVCKELSTENLCSIAAVDLPQPATKTDAQTLAIEMAVYPSAKLSIDATTGQLICPSDVTFDTLGFPEASIQPCDASTGTCAPTPAIGGIAFYHPGDSETIVDLGCVDLAQLNDISCTGGVAVAIRSSVDDLDTEVSVSSSLADQLTVAVGEPKPVTLTTGETHYQLNSVDLLPLVRATGQSVPGWNGTLNRELATLCTTVLEDAAGSTTSVRCKTIPSSTYAVEHPTIDTNGTRLAKPTLDGILAALGQPLFPATGLVVGVVLDANGTPVSNLQISASQGAVRYLTADRSGLTTRTSSNGIFLSQDAPFGSTFTASSGGLTKTGLGGVIEGRVTIVVLQFEPPAGQ
ncbi:hypothetical protein BH11MYX1_BH11MYX1_42370 [soil metagenome]